MNVDDLDGCHADILKRVTVLVLHLHIFKAARLGVTAELIPHSLFAMSAHLDNTLVWIAFDNSYVLMVFCLRYGAAFIGMVVAGVYVFYLLVSTFDSDRFL